MDIFGNTLEAGDSVAFVQMDAHNRPVLEKAVITDIDWDTDIIIVVDQTGTSCEVEAHLVIKNI